jgi:hypothetical protein
MKPSGGDARDDESIRLVQVPTAEDRQRRWEVRAAHWRAHALAQEIFRGEVRTHLMGMRTAGKFRGLLRMEVPFRDLEGHREAEARFLAAAGGDPLLEAVPLLFVVGPDASSLARTPLEE